MIKLINDNNIYFRKSNTKLDAINKNLDVFVHSRSRKGEMKQKILNRREHVKFLRQISPLLFLSRVSKTSSSLSLESSTPSNSSFSSSWVSTLTK